MISRGSRLSSLLGISTLLLMTLGGPAPGSAQTGDAQTGAAQRGDALVVHGPDGSSLSLPVERSRGYATVSHEALLQLGWAVEVDPLGLRAQLGPGGPSVEFSLGSPLFRWERSQIWEYVKKNDVPYNKLHEEGYPTIGCTHCTKSVPGSLPGEYSRKGRWQDSEKTECGLHGGEGI